MGKRKGKLSEKDVRELQVNLEKLNDNPDDVKAAYNVGCFLHKDGKDKEALSMFTKAFNNSMTQKKYKDSVNIAEAILSIESANLEVMHQLSQIAEKRNLAIPVLEIYSKFKKFHDVELFTALSDVEFLNVLRNGIFKKLRKNRKIIKEGEVGDSIFLITQGSVEVSKKAKRKKVVLGQLQKGDFFGEIGYMSNKVRSASITTLEPSEFMGWSSETIRDLSHKHPEVGRALYKVFWERSLNSVLTLSPVFSELSDAEREALKANFSVKYFMPNEVILHENVETSENTLYLIKKGEAAVFNKKKGSFKRPMITLKPGDIFGEFSVVTGKPPSATVMANSALEVLALSRSQLVELINSHPEIARTLERFGESRLTDSVLYLKYFQILEDIRADQSW